MALRRISSRHAEQSTRVEVSSGSVNAPSSSSPSPTVRKLLLPKEQANSIAEDLKESKERLQSEGEVLSNTIARKDRLLHESASRLAFTENSLLALQTAHALALQAHKSRLKELEESTAKAEEGKTRAEGEYAALRAGMSSMSEGWRADLDWLRADLAKVELRHTKDLDEARGKYLARTFSHLRLARLTT